MSTYVAEAFEIITDDGRGIPLSVGAIPAIGLAADGHIVIISGRFNITSGDGKIITGDTTRPTWYDKVLAQDFFAGLSRNANFVEAGCIEEVSGMTLSLVNTDRFFETLEINGINLARRVIKYYRVTSSDGITFNFEQRWQGVVDEQPYSELRYSIQCLDNSKEIFKSIPNKPADSGLLTSVPEENKDKLVPVAFGRVARSPTVNVNKPGKKVMLATVGGLDYDVAAVMDGSTTDRYIGLKTTSVSFGADDDAVVGKYMSIVDGGVKQAIRINANDATSSDVTRFYLDEPPDVSTPFSFWISTSNPEPDVWYAQILDLNPILLVTTNPVGEILPDGSGLPRLGLYDSEKKLYRELSSFSQDYDDVNIKATGYPGVSMVSRSADQDGTLFSYAAIKPIDIKVISRTGWTSDTLPANLSSAPNLFDINASSNYSLTLNSAGTPSLTLDIYLPKDKILEQFSEIYILPDLLLTGYAGAIFTLAISASLKDFYGRTSGLAFPNYEIKHSTIASPEQINRLPGMYYGVTRDDTAFYGEKHNYKITDLTTIDNRNKTYNVIRVTLSFDYQTISPPLIVNLQEFGLVGKISVPASNDTIYATVNGETFGRGWDGRKIPSDNIYDGINVLEKGIRDFDTSTLPWRVATAYVVGDQIRSSQDNGHIFVCTVAGTSHATTEPTWTDTAGATYADGSVTWRELREIPIDTASFDVAQGQLSDMWIGRTLIDKEPSEDIYKGLCKQLFAILTFDKKGNAKPKVWRENTVPTISFNYTNIIPGSLGQMTLSPMRLAYNQFSLSYAWNPGSGTYDKKITITHVDRPVFPGSGVYDTAIPGLLKWKTYVTGISDYTTAKNLWDPCHAAWCISKVIQDLPEELGKCPWFFDPYAQDANAKYIWSDDGGATCNIPLGDEHAAVFYLRNLVAWSTKQKKQITFEVVDNATHSVFEIGDPVYFDDPKLTRYTNYLAWIHEKTQLPRTQTQPERFRFGVTLDPG